MQHHLLVSEEILDSKADLADSRGLLPELVFRLITASIKNPAELRIPFRGAIGQPGWDGIVVSPYSFDPYVPQGQSFWEIGTGNDPQDKATKVFKQRTKQTVEADRKSSTFVFVTQRSAKGGWSVEKQKKWIDERRGSSGWKDIRILDASKLTQWLYLFPGIDRWLAGEFGIPNTGLTHPLVHWDDLRRYGSPPDLSPDLFMIEREKAVEQLLRVFRGETNELLLQTRYPEEGVDFVAAVLASLDLPERYAYAGRCLIVDEPETWKELCVLQNPHVLIATSSLDPFSTGAHLLSQALSRGHSVICAGTPTGGAHRNTVPLIEAKPYDMEKVLVSLGYSTEKARKLSHECNGRTTILKRLLGNLPASPEWSSSGVSSELALAALIGKWNGNIEGDREAIEGVLGKAYGDWIGKIRPTTLRPDPPLIQRHEKWRFVSRFEGWQCLGSYLFNPDLDRFLQQVIIVLREKDPKFTLPAEERWKASIHNKTPKYSDVIREGFAETLALLGAHPGSLTSCSPGKPNVIAALAVREILKDTDWEHWASLNDVLPLLAEASPDEFLEAIEEILGNPQKTVFQDLYSQEGTGFMGGWNYMTGVLWALETLAWHQDYLTRVTVILGKLAEMDPGGNWANRPSNSLTTIFLPWLPQTCASVDMRKAALEALRRECPDIAWKLILNLLPSSHQITSGSRKPSWRDFIPLDYSEKVTAKEYFSQVSIYASLATQIAKSNPKKLTDLIDRLDDLSQPAFDEILTHLSSPAVVNMSEQEKVELWETLVDLVVKHRKFADENWAMSKEHVDRLADVAETLKPLKPELFYRRLFCQREFELIEEKDNYEEQWRQLATRREKAVKELLEANGINGLLAFAQSVTEPLQVGLALGNIASEEHDEVVLPRLLTHAEKSLKNLADGYVWSRFNKNGWPWADSIIKETWTDDEKAAFLVLLPFGRESWKRAKEILKENENLFWKRTDARPYHLEDQLPEAVELLLEHGRPRAAIRCIYVMLDKKVQPSVEAACRALLGNLTTDEPLQSLDQHACTEIIQWLQSNASVDTTILSKIEWAYLPLLDRHFGLAPKTLEKRLAEDPEFFCEVIRLIFRSDKEEQPSQEPTEEQKRFAHNAYDLLYKWRTPPGTKHDGSFDRDLLIKWLEHVKNSCEASGHLRIALDQVGKVLAHSPEDPSGLWIHRGVAEVLNDERHEVMRLGYRVELFNKRGTFTWTAGEDEKRLAKEYREKAAAVDREGYFRLAACLRDLAASYEHDADREASRDPFDR
jgi:hypothetical protein